MSLPSKPVNVTSLNKTNAQFVFEVKTKRLGPTNEFCLALADLIASRVDITKPEFMDTGKRYLNTDFAVLLMPVVSRLNETFYLDTQKLTRMTMQLINYRIDNMLGGQKMLFSVKPYIDASCHALLDCNSENEARIKFVYCYNHLSEIMLDLH